MFLCLCWFEGGVSCVCVSVGASRYCKGDKKQLPVADFDVTPADLCRSCKYIRDTLHGIAKSQSGPGKVCLCARLGKSMFSFIMPCDVLTMCLVMCVVILVVPGELQSYQEMIQDNDLLHGCIRSYKEHKKAVQSGQVSRNQKFSLAKVTASMKKTTGVDILQKGTLMCKRRYCTWVSDRFFI